MDQDIPLIDADIEKMSTDLRHDLADYFRGDLYAFAKGVLGYTDMTPKVHGPFCSFLQHNRKQFKLALMPRDHFKTSVGTVAGNMHLAVNDPNHRILIGNETGTNAERMLGIIQDHCDSNRRFRALFNNVIPKNTREVRWNTKELDWNRDWIGPEPTFDAIGMTGTVTSRHYTHICYDDPISEEAIKSEKVMKDTISRMSAMTALLVKPKFNTVWLIGTRWAMFDVYSWFRESFASRLGILARSVIEDGEIIFPELIDEEMLAIKRKVMGDYKFSCLMVNNPRDGAKQDFDVENAEFWEWDSTGTRVLIYNAEGLIERIWRLDELDITVTVDPAPAETTTSDRNAITTCGITPTNEVIVLDVFARRCTPLEVIEYLFALWQRFRFRAVGIEGVAYQKSLKYFVTQEMMRRGHWFRVEELKALGKKEYRIRGLQPILAMGRMYFNARQQLLMQEMSDFPLGEYDDTVDSLSMHLQMWKGRLSPEHLERIEAEARRMANQIHGYGLRNDPGPDPEIARAMGLEVEDEEIEPETNFDEYLVASDVGRY